MSSLMKLITHLIPRILPAGFASLLGLLPAHAAPYPLPAKTVDAAPAGELTASSGIPARLTAASPMPTGEGSASPDPDSASSESTVM